MDRRTRIVRPVAASLDEERPVQGARWWLICYDVHNKKRLRKCAKHMEGYGERMQYSVFRCWLTPRDMQRLRWELTELLASEDEVLLIPLCDRCVDGIQGTHSAVNQPDWPEKPEGHKII
jgi:CRISPR-associated protein Cas2